MRPGDLLYSYQNTYLHPGMTPEEFYSEFNEDYKGMRTNIYDKLYGRFDKIRDCLEGGCGYPDGDFFRIFHRRPNSYLGLLCKKPNGGIKGIGFIKVKDIDDALGYLIDEHEDLVKSDLYFTVNSYFKPHRGVYKDTKLKRINRKETNLSYLNACYVDIDVGRFDEEEQLKHFSWDAGLLQALLLEDDGIIPPVNVFARSGRGIYLMWLLDNTKALPEKIGLYKKINKELNLRIGRQIFSDKGAHDAARILRVAESLHSHATKFEKQDVYTMYHLEDVTPYSLEELVEYLVDNPLTKRSPRKALKRAKSEGSAPKRSAGPMKTYSRRYYDLIKLEERIGGFKQGKRYSCLNYAAVFMKRSGKSEKEILKELKELAARCAPPYPTRNENNDLSLKDIAQNACNGSSGIPAKLKNEYLANFFEVTEEIANELDLVSIRPSVKKKLTGRHKIKERQEALEAMFQDSSPSLSECVDILCSDYSILTSRKTVLRDIRALMESGRISRTLGKPGRPGNK